MAVSNLEYDILTVLQSKLEGLEAYDKYLRDCQEAGDEEARSLFDQLRQDDEKAVHYPAA